MHMLQVVVVASCTACVILAERVQPTPDVAARAEHLRAVQDYAVGDPRRCLEVEKRNDYKVERFEVLPGYGWDNLRNVEQGQVISFNFSQCRTTDDGRFLLPDSVSAVPIKASRVETFAELINHYKDWTSTDSKTVNVDAGLNVRNVAISGRFSAEFEETKSKQIGDKSVTTRAQVRYVRYAVQLQPDTPLHPVFKGRLLDIAAAHQLNQTEQARYLSQLLVRDFGTHLITKARAGAALLKVDHVDEDWVKSMAANKRDILVSASVSLFQVFNMSSSFETKHEDKYADEYNKHRTSSVVETKGGPIFKPAFTPDLWAKEVDSDLVAMDRAGDPLYYVVTAGALRELPLSTLQQVVTSVQQAVVAYYDFNVYPGCLEKGSPSFSPAANVDDGSCHPPSFNLTFGGMYQTCSMSSSANGDLCGGMTEVNPKTGGLSCPPQYQAVRLFQGTRRTSRSEHHCKHFLFIKYHCTDTFYESRAAYELYWCAAVGSVPQNTGYLFGGLYTSLVRNPVTRAQSCPPSFFSLKVGSNKDLRVCISDDYEFGQERAAVPLAGFTSCSSGNPLALAGTSDQSNKVKSGASNSQTQSLRSFYSGQAGSWPQRCPEGYSMHLATIDEGCQINYCVQTGALAGPTLPQIKRPPFMPLPALFAPSSDNLVVFDPESRTWTKNAAAESYMSWMQMSSSTKVNGAESDQGDATSAVKTFSSGETAGLTVGAALTVVLLVAVAFLVVKIRRRRQNSMYRPIDGSLPLETDGHDYGTVGNTGSVNASA